MFKNTQLSEKALNAMTKHKWPSAMRIPESTGLQVGAPPGKKQGADQVLPLPSHLPSVLKDYFLFIPNAVELFSSNFTFFSVFDIPAGLGEKICKFSQKGSKVWNHVLHYN